VRGHGITPRIARQLPVHPYHPFWASLITVLDVFVVCALAVQGRELRDVAGLGTNSTREEVAPRTRLPRFVVTRDGELGG
jgi:hypothetical protein